MSRRKKDPLRPLIDTARLALTRLSRSHAAPAGQVARATRLLAVAHGDDDQQAAGAAGRRAGDAVAHRVTRFASTSTAGPLTHHARPVRSRASLIRPHASESSVRPGASRPPRPTAPPPGHSQRGSERSDRLPTDCPRSPPRRSGRGFTRPATPTRRAVPGAPPAPQSVSARTRRCASPTPTPRRKQVDRGRRPHGGGDGPAGRGHRSGRPVPDGAPSRSVLASPGPAGADAARVSPRRHGQGADARRSGRRSRPDRGRDLVSQDRFAGRAQAGADRRARRDARTAGEGRNERGGGANDVGAWAARADDQADAPGRTAAVALRMLLVWDNLAGHKTPEFVCWLFESGVMPRDTPVGGSWRNMAESLQRILTRRALDGQDPTEVARIIAGFEAVVRHGNSAPRPFVSGGRRAARRRRQRERRPRRGGSGAGTRKPLHRGPDQSYRRIQHE
jgi:hypothetical protein